MKGVVFNSYGGPDVLSVVDLPAVQIGSNQVLIRHTAIGVNKIDIQCRTGAYESNTCGVEACGVIERVGDDVDGYNVGDRVVYATAPFGAYCTKRAVDVDYIIRAPDDIADDILAASLSKCLTAHYLSYRTLRVAPGMGILIHDASSVTGQYLSRWISGLGAFVIGVVTNEEQEAIAKNSGCHHVIKYGQGLLSEQIKDRTGGLLLNAVYHSVNSDIISQSLECLRSMGMLIIFDQPPKNLGSIDLSVLHEKSLFVTCTTLQNYKSNRNELVLSAEEVFAMIRTNKLEVNIEGKYTLYECAKAHSAFESAYGSIVIIP